jgi:hypothetical protein
LGMAREVRTIIIVVTMAVTVIAVSPAASAPADVGDLLGAVWGGNGSEPPQQTPPQQPPPQSGPPDSGGPKSGDRSDGPPKDPLLAPESSCRGQSDPGLRPIAQKRAMVCMLSFARVAERLSALHAYKPLQASATDKARDIRRCQRLSHEACGRSPWYWIEHVGFFKGVWEAGEVLAVLGGERGTVRGTMRAWLDSEEHRAVLLHPGFNLVGVGTVTGRFRGFRGMRIWVAHFGDRH